MHGCRRSSMRVQTIQKRCSSWSAYCCHSQVTYENGDGYPKEDRAEPGLHSTGPLDASRIAVTSVATNPRQTVPFR